MLKVGQTTKYNIKREQLRTALTFYDGIQWFSAKHLTIREKLKNNTKVWLVTEISYKNKNWEKLKNNTKLQQYNTMSEVTKSTKEIV